VSSVEFCKHVKFDDRKDHNSRDNNNNRTRTQGRSGQQGPAGPQGPQGLPSPNKILPENLYYRQGNIGVGFSDQTVNSTSVCNSRDIVIEGDFAIFPNPQAVPNTLLEIIKNVTNSDTNEFGKLEVSVRGTNMVVQSSAICFDNP
jgi:hypothetical protein